MTRFSAALAAMALLSFPSAGEASGLIDNVNGITTGADGRIMHFGGLLVSTDGKVERRLSAGEKLPKKQKLDFRMDGKGQTLIPGFVDARADIMRFAISLLSLDLSSATSTQDVAARVTAYAAEGRRWILGFGWDATRWAATDDGQVSTALLDRAAPGTPVWLVDASGEQGWANSAALKLAGITAATPQPAGGRIVMAGGKPTGLLTGTAMDMVERLAPRPAPKDLDAAFLKAQAAYLARGVTAVGDVATSMANWQTWRRAGDRNALRMRIVGYTATVDDLPLIAGPQQTPWLYDGHLRLAGVNLALDGGVTARRAWLSTPYADAPGESGAPLLHDTRLRNQMSRAAMDGFQIILAAHGDRATREAADAMAEMGGAYLSRGRWRIDGADLIAPTDMDGLPADRLSIVVSPASIADGGALARTRLGAMADARAYGWQAIATRQAVLAFSGNGPFTPLSPLDAIRIAMTGGTADGAQPGGGRPEQRLTLEQAFRAATAGGAAALGAEGRFGTLAPGEQADFLLLDRDIEQTKPADLPRIRILETWIGGQKMVMGSAK
ncbi:MAG: amidohydrolase family protein [Sphingobium sp.]